MEQLKLSLITSLAMLCCACATQPHQPLSPYPVVSWEAFKKKHPSYVELRDESRIKDPIKGQVSKFTRIYNSTRQEAPELEGMIVFGLAISPSGTVLDTVVIKSSIQHHGLIQKLHNGLQAVRFDPFLDGIGRVSDFTFYFHIG